MQLPHWEYFLALCRDFQQAIQYVELAQDNFATYSTQFARLYLAAGSEIDVVAKLLCQQITPTSKDRNIDEYRVTILAKYPDFVTVEVELPRHMISLVPWDTWKTGTNPVWWRSYNDVKHERNRFFKQANLQNTLDAIAGLFVLLGYLHDAELRQCDLLAFPDLMRFPAKYREDAFFVQRDICRLPGIPKPTSQSP